MIYKELKVQLEANGGRHLGTFTKGGLNHYHEWCIKEHDIIVEEFCADGSFVIYKAVPSENIDVALPGWRK